MRFVNLAVIPLFIVALQAACPGDKGTVSDVDDPNARQAAEPAHRVIKMPPTVVTPAPQEPNAADGNTKVIVAPVVVEGQQPPAKADPKPAPAPQGKPVPGHGHGVSPHHR